MWLCELKFILLFHLKRSRPLQKLTFIMDILPLIIPILLYIYALSFVSVCSVHACSILVFVGENQGYLIGKYRKISILTFYNEVCIFQAPRIEGSEVFIMEDEWEGHTGDKVLIPSNQTVHDSQMFTIKYVKLNYIDGNSNLIISFLIYRNWLRTYTYSQRGNHLNWRQVKSFFVLGDRFDIKVLLKLSFFPLPKCKWNNYINDYHMKNIFRRFNEETFPFVFQV